MSTLLKQTNSLATPVVVVADGAFPRHSAPMELLRKAATIVCCDGACEKLLQHGFTPHYIVGDMDSISPLLQQRFAAILRHFPDQETNDLTKAVKFCIAQGCDSLDIVGATGGREDHTIGNIALLADYAAEIRVKMVTDTGIFTPLLSSATLNSFAGQEVSIFCLTPETRIIAKGLKYSLDKVIFDTWWKGTLNEATGHSIDLQFSFGKIIVYQRFNEQ
ncbi:MAG: thiamine diphosphokinase [Bacteroidales bacterium]|nr:thiamine diphosphokinase [Bacteroidales bacterium]MCL2133718.1 thiamine diphosphokinase [Bacteroidales bacterium]